jgi:hypothetical protein
MASPYLSLSDYSNINQKINGGLVKNVPSRRVGGFNVPLKGYPKNPRFQPVELEVKKNGGGIGSWMARWNPISMFAEHVVGKPIHENFGNQLDSVFKMAGMAHGGTVRLNLN